MAEQLGCGGRVAEQLGCGGRVVEQLGCGGIVGGAVLCVAGGDGL